MDLLLNIQAHVSELKTELANGLNHKARHRIQTIINMLIAVDSQIDIRYTVSQSSTNQYVYLDTVSGLKKSPLAFELGDKNFNYRWPGIISEIDTLNNAVLLKYPLPEVPHVGSMAFQNTKLVLGDCIRDGW